MQQILIDSIPHSRRQHLDSVTKINNALRRQERVYCTLGNTTHQITGSRHRGLTFQVQIAGKWHDTVINNVWKEKGTPGKANADTAHKRSHRDAMEQAIVLLRQRTYTTNLSAGPTWQVALSRAQHWSPIGRAGVLFSAEEDLERCFDEHGNLTNHLSCAWQGDFTLIAACLHEYGFAVTQTESPDPRWSGLAISLLSQESQVTHKQTSSSAKGRNGHGEIKP